ncbi:MAG: hypothetical protein HYS07_07095 [Chlamydiae bacterium]|nr:hypothetical protein [Chlamydiota bacterium]MBI3276909.1 hypothetical protein [Chlamydiota bacterium]
MSIESMLLSLELEAEKERKKIEEETELEISQIKKDAQVRIAKNHEEMMGSVKRAMDIEEAREMGQAKSQANRILLEARQKEIERVFDQAKQNIHQRSQAPDRSELLGILIQEALKDVSGKVMVETAAQDIQSVQEILKKLKVEAETKPNSKITGGIILKTLDHRLQIENTLSGRLSKAENSLKVEVAEKLWPNK